MDLSKIKIEITSDISLRDGIGIEVFFKNTFVLDIFRDDIKKTKEMTLFKKDVSLELIEFSIKKFKELIPQDYIDYH
ncbi:MAG: hypothetical protein ACKVIG_15435 [Flavobacteriales bacterium]